MEVVCETAVIQLAVQSIHDYQGNLILFSVQIAPNPLQDCARNRISVVFGNLPNQSLEAIITSRLEAIAIRNNEKRKGRKHIASSNKCITTSSK